MRDPKIFVIVGGRGSGKTYFLENRLNRSNTVVIELVKTNRWDGYKKFFYEDIENKTVNIKELGNKKVVFEDATSYVSATMKNSLKQLIVHSKQLGSDVYIVFHSVNIIPPFLWNMFNYLVLFTCAEPRETATNREYFNTINAAWKRLQKSAKYKFEVIQSNS